MTPATPEIDAQTLYASMKKHGATAKGLMTPNEKTHRQRLDVAALLARYCVNHWETGNILDIGCGYGDMIPRLNDISTNFGYTGVDMTPWILATAKTRFGSDPKVRLQQRHLDELNDEDAAELILLLGILATVNDEELEPLLKKVWSLAKVALIMSWTEKSDPYAGKLRTHNLDQLTEILGPHVLIAGFAPDEPHKIALWIKE